MACKLKTVFSASRHLIRNEFPGALKQICKRNLPVSLKTRHHYLSTSANPKWLLWSGVCLERPAVVTQPTNDLEKDCQQLMHQLEHENSFLSEHEVHLREDVVEAEKLSHQEDPGDADVTRQTALDLEDVWESYYNKFTSAPRTTEADRENDCRSLKRRLDRKLILVVKQRLGEDNWWVFPQGQRSEGESMRQTAERVLQTSGGDSVTAMFLGNAPCGLYSYKLPAAVQSATSCDGVKVFFFKAHLRSGQIKAGEGIEDHLWLTKEELKNYLHPAYYKDIKDFILEL